MEQIALQIAIAFFGVQVAAWAGLGLYIRLTHSRRNAQVALASLLSDVSAEFPVAQAA